MKAPTSRIESIKPLNAQQLEVLYAGGQTVVVDCTELVERFEVFAPLQDPIFFGRVRVTDYGHTLEWPNGEGLDANRVMEMALEQQCK